MYSTAFSGNNNTYQQVIQWHEFVGSGLCVAPSQEPGHPLTCG